MSVQLGRNRRSRSSESVFSMPESAFMRPESAFTLLRTAEQFLLSGAADPRGIGTRYSSPRR